MSSISVAPTGSSGQEARLDYAAGAIPPFVLSERLAERIGNYRATQGGEALRAEFDRFCSRLYRRMLERDPGAADVFRAGLNQRLREAGERGIMWTRE